MTFTTSEYISDANMEKTATLRRYWLTINQVEEDFVDELELLTENKDAKQETALNSAEHTA